MLGILFLSILGAGTAFSFRYFIRSNQKSLQNGDFISKYNELIHLLTDQRKSEIEQVKSRSISIRIKLNKDSHLFTISEVDERLIVVWKLNSSSLGQRGKEWSFNPSYSQSKMYGEVLGDIRKYQEALRAEHPYQDESFLSAV